MIRRLLNVVVENTSTHVQSLRRIDPYKHLFYASAGEAAAAASKPNKTKNCTLGMQTLSLPKPVVSFSSSNTSLPSTGGMDLFALLGTRGSHDRILSANVIGESMLYDADEGLIHKMPWMKKHKGWNPVCLPMTLPGAVENSLYVIERWLGESKNSYSSIKDYTIPCFEVLEFGGKKVRDKRRDWGWRVLPPPPFLLQPNYQPSYIISYTSMVNNTNSFSTIYISFEGIGTYCFDTYLEEWRHFSEWTLPFHGKAKYIPEFNMWFAFSSDSRKQLCALDLSALQKDKQQAPIVQHVFEDLNPPIEDLNPPIEEDWSPTTFELINLGEGKFCVAKSFDFRETIGQQFAVLTGIQIVRGDNNGLCMIKHKSTCYTSVNDSIDWVL